MHRFASRFLPLAAGFFCLLSFVTRAADPVASTAAGSKDDPIPPELRWHDVTQWGVEGRAWADLPRERWFDRFPAEAKGKVTDKVWQISHSSTGMAVQFRTDAPVIWARYSLTRATLSHPRSSAIAASGLDLYARDPHGTWRWVGNTMPTRQNVLLPLFRWSYALLPGMHEYMAYLPLDNGLEDLAIGVPPTAKFEPVPPRRAQPIVFYGTSITQGAAASRPGILYTAILGRRLDVPVVNLGFGGNGRMDLAVADLMVKIDAAIYVVDCLPNMNPPEVRERCIPFIKRLRATRPDVPIVLVEDRRYTCSWLMPELERFYDENHAILREAFATLRREGVHDLYYIEGDKLLGDDGEGTTDASHPNDLGNMRYADAFEPVLRAAFVREPISPSPVTCAP